MQAITVVENTKLRLEEWLHGNLTSFQLLRFLIEYLEMYEMEH